MYELMQKYNATSLCSHVLWSVEAKEKALVLKTITQIGSRQHMTRWRLKYKELYFMTLFQLHLLLKQYHKGL
jgi:hypothetical protein